MPYKGVKRIIRLTYGVEGGWPSKEVRVSYGFWLYRTIRKVRKLMSSLVSFAGGGGRSVIF